MEKTKLEIKFNNNAQEPIKFDAQLMQINFTFISNLLWQLRKIRKNQIEFIIQDKNNKWGVLYISSNIEAMIPFEYDFIGLKNELDSDSKLVSNKFIVKQDENWYLVDTVNKKLTSSFDYPIYDYNDKVVVLYNDTYMLYDYEAKRLVPSLNIEKYMFENSYTGIISNNKLYIYYVWQNGPVKVYDINSNSNIKLEYKDYKIYVYDNDNLLDSFN